MYNDKWIEFTFLGYNFYIKNNNMKLFLFTKLKKLLWIIILSQINFIRDIYLYYMEKNFYAFMLHLRRTIIQILL